MYKVCIACHDRPRVCRSFNFQSAYRLKINIDRNIFLNAFEIKKHFIVVGCSIVQITLIK